MIKLVLLDLGETLIHKGKPFPGVVAALEEIGKLKTAAGQPVVLGLLSDYYLPDPPGDEAAITAKEAEYRKVLESAGLERFFRPFEKRVTLSTRAGVNKPARKIFELAVERSGITARLTECLFVTEETRHLTKAKEFGLTAIRFGTGPGFEPVFGDWADAPRLFTRWIGG